MNQPTVLGAVSLTVAASLFGPMLRGQTPVNFDAIRTYDVPTGRSIAPEPDRACRSNLAVVDVNRDGRLDLVTGEITGSADTGFHLTTLFGNGDGTFYANAPQADAVGEMLPIIASADLDGDGVPDVAIANGTSVVIAFGTWDGTVAVSLLDGPFASRIEAAIAIGDFNGDGKPDVVLLGEMGNVVTVFLNQGARLFRAIANQVELDHAHGLVVSDFDGDGQLDLAIASGENSFYMNPYAAGITIFHGNGDGSFRRGLSLRTIMFPVSLAVGDFNGDGIPDLTTGQRVFSGIGNGAFEYMDTGIGYDYDGTCVAVADLDGDGSQDLMIERTGRIELLHGKGDGAFDAPSSLAAGNRNISILTGDWNADGSPDAVLVDADPVSATILMNEGTGQFHTPPAYAVCCEAFGKVASGDLDGDGGDEIIYTEPISGQLVVLNTRPGDALAESGWYPAPFLTAPVVSDLNQDGFADIVMLDSGFGDGIGKLLPMYGLPCCIGLLLGQPTIVNPGEGKLFAADLNGDGAPDLVIVRDHQFSTPFAGLEVALSNADGTFRAPESMRRLALTGNPRVVAGDFDRDGRMDIVVSSDEGSYLLTGNGDGTFGLPALLEGFRGPAAAADLTGDGMLDLVLGGAPAGLMLLRGLGDGTFADPVPLQPSMHGNTSSALPRWPLVIADMNADGIPDLIYRRGNQVSVKLGTGDGSFSTPTSFGAGYFNDFTIADVDRDGLPDIVLSTEGGVTVLRNTTVRALGSGQSSNRSANSLARCSACSREYP